MNDPQAAGVAGPFAAEVVVLPRCRLGRSLSPATAARFGANLAALQPWAGLGFTAAGLATYLSRDDPALHRYRVEVDGAPAGVIAIRHPWLRGPYLELLGLWPSFQGRGLSGELLAWLETSARGVADNLWTAVSADNARARDFYAAAGFRPVGRLDDLIQAGRDEWLLRKRL